MHYKGIQVGKIIETIDDLTKHSYPHLSGVMRSSSSHLAAPAPAPAPAPPPPEPEQILEPDSALEPDLVQSPVQEPSKSSRKSRR